ncbi:DNA-binding transcriptional regulator, AcrR family [Amycolatopsis pretoriensis]|uniref:DNA-binding transcriptional regulator, AcrR family n=1 Tax=Amycolatopsis pretoriensis TaxID=218821 RepID=A0A1H5RGC1_9PSEU|nr:TetR/AcrR family transcriptional regulator [Amycolatopsis pretoriensis]SEF37405.1 DNA-binding transcriptional regulator, AcrR family [Amycolatopsis pretoriensis]
MPTTSKRDRVSRAEQKARTRAAIVDACRTLIASGRMLTMPEVAELAGVSEATAYRHFSEIVELINAALVGMWPTPAEALEPVAGSTDPADRLEFATEVLLRRVVAYQGSVRAVIAATVVNPPRARARPGFRFGLIDEALDPVVPTRNGSRLAQLKQDLAAVVSADAFFSLTDLCGLDTEAAIASLRRTARTLVTAALPELTEDRGDAAPG